MVQNLCKNWLQVSKIIWGIWITSDKQWKVQKLKFNGLHFFKNYIPSLKHYLQIYLTFLSTDLLFGKWHEEYGNFFSEHSKLGFWWDSLIQTWKSRSLKSTVELYVMTMKNYAKFEEKLTCHFKVDIRNLTNFDLSTRKSQKFSL